MLFCFCSCLRCLRELMRSSMWRGSLGLSLFGVLNVGVLDMSAV